MSSEDGDLGWLIPELEDLLDDVAAGEIAVDDARVRRAAENSPEFAARVRALSGAREAVLADVELVRDALALPVCDADRRVVVDTLRSLSSDQGGEQSSADTRRPDRPRPWRWLLLAAAGALIALLVITNGKNGGSPQVLGGPFHLDLAEPSLAAGRPLTWTPTRLAEGGGYRVEIDPGAAGERWHSEILRAPEWVPAATLLERLPDSVRVRVIQLDDFRSPQRETPWRDVQVLR